MVLRMQRWLDTAPQTNYSNEGGEDDSMGQTVQEGQVSCLHLRVTRALKLRPERYKAAHHVKEWEFEVLRELDLQRPEGNRESTQWTQTTSHLEHGCSK